MIDEHDEKSPADDEQRATGELSEDALEDVAGGNDPAISARMMGGTPSGGSRGGGGASGTFHTGPTFQPLKTEPGEELDGDMTDPILRK